MAYGLRPHNSGGYNYSTGGHDVFQIDSGYTTRISAGDMVAFTADHGIVRLATAPVPAIFAATSVVPSNQAVGVFVGCEYVDSNTGQLTHAQFFPASGVTAGSELAYVITDPGARFTIQATGAWTETYLGIVIDPTMTAGTGTDGNSGLVLPDYSADAAGALRIWGVVRNGANESSSTTPDVIVGWSSPTCLLSGYQTAV